MRTMHRMQTAQAFLSTPSARRATWSSARFCGASVFLSTPSARRATHDVAFVGERNFISIHALREEGDKLRSATLSSRSVFLSTPSARRATPTAPSSITVPSISIHALREEGDQGSRPDRQAHAISIHALREEGDSHDLAGLREVGVFLSTPSARRATARCGGSAFGSCISIHALREEGDRQTGDEFDF